MSILGDNIKTLREKNKMTLKELADKSGVGQSTINDIEKAKAKNPKSETLSKLASIFHISMDELLFNEWNYKYTTRTKQELSFYETAEFKTAEEAIQFILKQPKISAYGGFDVNKMSDEDIIEFANDLLGVLKALGAKYKR